MCHWSWNWFYVQRYICFTVCFPGVLISGLIYFMSRGTSPVICTLLWPICQMRCIYMIFFMSYRCQAPDTPWCIFMIVFCISLFRIYLVHVQCIIRTLCFFNSISINFMSSGRSYEDIYLYLYIYIYKFIYIYRYMYIYIYIHTYIHTHVYV